MRNCSIFVSLLFAALLAGCVTNPQVAARLPDMTFDNLKKVELNVRSVEVRDDYLSPMMPPHVEHLFSVPLYTVAENLLKSQLISMGSENVLRAIIVEASVVRTELAIDHGFQDFLMRKPAEQFDAKVLLRFELFNERAPDIVLGHAEVEAKRTKTLLEGSSAADRDTAYYELTEGVMNDLNNGLQTVVKSTFGIHQ